MPFQLTDCAVQVLFVGAVAMAGCNRQPANRLQFVVPDSFEGAIHVYVNREDGQEGQHRADTVYFEVPKAGLLAVKGNPFSRWHRLSASFRSGEPIGVYADTMPDDANGVVIANYGFNADGRGIYYIGPVKEHRRLQQDRWAAQDIPPGSTCSGLLKGVQDIDPSSRDRAKADGE